MDYLTRQLLLQLTKLRESYEKQSAAVSAISERDRKHQQIQEKWLKDIFPAYEESKSNDCIV
jgi:hypothetical protein